MKNNIRPTFVIGTFLVAVFHQVGAADDMIFPGREWQQASPESQGVDSAKLQAAVDYLREAAGKEGVKRMVIVRNGRMIWRGPEADTAAGRLVRHQSIHQHGARTVDRGWQVHAGHLGQGL